MKEIAADYEDGQDNTPDDGNEDLFTLTCDQDPDEELSVEWLEDESEYEPGSVMITCANPDGAASIILGPDKITKLIDELDGKSEEAWNAVATRFETLFFVDRPVAAAMTNTLADVMIDGEDESARVRAVEILIEALS